MIFSVIPIPPLYFSGDRVRSTLRAYSPRLSFTAISMSCSDPRYRSVVWMEECPSRNLICSEIPAVLAAELGAGTAQVVGERRQVLAWRRAQPTRRARIT